MIIKKHITDYIVLSNDSITSAITKANSNGSRLIFAVGENGILKGVATDGDLRRWLISSNEINLNNPVSEIINRDFISAPITATNSDISSIFSSKIKAIPLIDNHQRLVAVALPYAKQYKISDAIISEESPVFIIAEIGNNHNGSLDKAKKLIDEAIVCGADCVKFQMRNMNDLYKSYSSPTDHSADLGTQYTFDLLDRFQLPDDQLFQAFDYCKEKGIIHLCTPWDLSSLKKLEQYGSYAYKIASADFTNYEMIDAASKTGKLMLCSTGMSTEKEVISGIRYIQQSGAPYILLHCNSTYPAPFKDVNLRYIERLKTLSGNIVGYSGHERDINVSIAAVALGAKVIEKHFTLDKSMEGNDHKVSLLPNEFSTMVKGIRQVEESMGCLTNRYVSQGEIMNRETLAKSLYATTDIHAGTIIQEHMIAIRSPGQGIQPCRKKDLLGKILPSDKKEGELFFLSDLGEGVFGASEYKFKRPWGIPVRYHDLQNLRQMSNMDLIEIHLSYQDIEIDFKNYLTEPLDLDLVVHAPELFKRDHILNLCSYHEDYRQHSIGEMQRIIDLTRELNPYFTKSNRTCIVTNVGGFSNDRHLSQESRKRLYKILEISLNQLDMEGVEIIPQTMPPFPWHFGGQQFHNLFMDDESIIDFCSRNKMRICLDVSHSKLACNFMKKSFMEFIKSVSPYVAHMHLSDAEGLDGEGLQVMEGDIDWIEFIHVINDKMPNATFIPEIWQGHKNNGEGAWRALDRLSKIHLL